MNFLDTRLGGRMNEIKTHIGSKFHFTLTNSFGKFPVLSFVCFAASQLMHCGFTGLFPAENETGLQREVRLKC